MQILYDINFAGVVIGFDPKRDVFSEESGRGQFTVRVITGRLGSNVTVLLSTASCVADSKHGCTSCFPCKLSPHSHRP